MRILVLAVLLAFPLACGGAPARSPEGTVQRVGDGDTIDLRDGRTVRLVQLDAPELVGECYGKDAKRVLARLLPPGTRVRIETDPALDRVDRFGRTLAYVVKDGVNVNLELVRAGAAAPYFFHGDRGRSAAQFLQAAQQAREQHRGFWGACPGTILDPFRQVDAER